jgi:hypothetical protein
MASPIPTNSRICMHIYGHGHCMDAHTLLHCNYKCTKKMEWNKFVSLHTFTCRVFYKNRKILLQLSAAGKIHTYNLYFNFFLYEISHVYVLFNYVVEAVLCLSLIWLVFFGWSPSKTHYFQAVWYHSLQQIVSTTLLPVYKYFDTFKHN